MPLNEQLLPALARYTKLKRLEVIVKISERCNIDCTYCYFFHGADNSFRLHPTFIQQEVIDDLTKFVREGVETLGLERAEIVLHGGEPLLLGKARFAKLCACLTAALTPVTDLAFSIQTNATLIDPTWIELFEQYHVEVGVSMDGPAEYHDVARVDFKGRGTYERVVRGVQLLNEASRQGRIEPPGVLCVINPAYSARTIYRHFADDLGFRSIDFLLPDTTHDTLPENERADSYGHYLCELFDVWTEDNNPAIFIRILASVFSLLLGGESFVGGFGSQLPPSVVIGSDGSLGAEDSLRMCGEQISQSGIRIKHTSLKEYVTGPFVTHLEHMYSDLSETCRQCCWQKVCGGGMFVNRYSQATGFKNPSVFCEGLKLFYAHAAKHLLAKGLPLPVLQKNLLEI